MGAVRHEQGFYEKDGVTGKEYTFHKSVFDSGIRTSKIEDWDATSGKLKTREIKGMTIADMYGEDADDVPERIFESIREIVQELTDIGIEFVDITGYNFILGDDEEVYVIDFEHAKEVKEDLDPFLQNFLEGEYSWNPEFA